MIELLTQQLSSGFPNTLRGKDLLTVADFSGTHAGSAFTSYAFLSLDIDRNRPWLSAQRRFRQQILKRRRMSYKALNDAKRREALLPFLILAEEIVGALTVLVIPRDFGPLLERDSHDDESILQLWKPRVHEHVLRVSHFAGMIAAFMSRSEQNVMIMSDQDEIAANGDQLTQLTELIARVLSNSLIHNLGHIRVGTTKSDDGSLALEDLASIADLAAGAVCEIMTALGNSGLGPKNNVISLLPNSASAKARMIGQWLEQPNSSLQRTILLFERGMDGCRYKLGVVKLHTMAGRLWTPGSMGI